MFKKLLLAAAVAAAAGGASAANYSIGNLSAGQPLSFSAATSGSFDDMVSFNLVGTGNDFNGALISTFSGSDTISGFSATLSGPSGYSSSWTYGSVTTPVKAQFLIGKESSLTAGAYTLRVTGAGQPNDSYALDLSVAAVPEPETYALMLAGLGVVGFIAKRRKG